MSGFTKARAHKGLTLFERPIVRPCLTDIGTDQLGFGSFRSGSDTLALSLSTSSNRDPTSTQGKLCPHLLFFLLGAGFPPGRGDGSAVLTRSQGPRATTERGLNTGQPCQRPTA